jgi:hypothetical protein
MKVVKRNIELVTKYKNLKIKIKIKTSSMEKLLQ